MVVNLFLYNYHVLYLYKSKNFILTKENSGRGDMPVYSLKVEFHNQIISNDELITIFSESDRRALALAIFWAKIDLKDDAEKSKTIVVLDDPITSFDDNRVSNSIDLFKTSLNNLSQIIILTSCAFRFSSRSSSSLIVTKL
jgi:wobble nucleotide-excising tRNase